ASNVIPRYDGNMSTAPDKKKSPDKIDDMTALLMAIGASKAEAYDPEDLDDFLSNPIIIG
ncbi:terminase, partial [Pseudomonas aeruginosa]